LRKRRQRKKEKEEKLKNEIKEQGIDENTVSKNESEEYKKYKFSIPLPNKENYKEIASQRFQGVLDLNNETDGWEELTKFEKKGFKAYKKHDEKSNIFYIKAVGIIRCSANTLLEWLYDPISLPETDPMFKKGDIVEEFDKDHMIYYGQWSLPWPMWHRDFIFSWNKTWTKEGIGIGAAISVVHPKYPEGEGVSKGHVRGEIIETGVVVKDLGKPEDLKSEFCYIVCVNPRGWIPNFLINIVAADQALNIHRTIKYWKKNEDKDPKAPTLPN